MNIYDRYDKKFKDISAYVILKDGESVGKVTIKYGARLYAFTHIYSNEMTCGTADGGNYDKSFSAVQAGFARTKPYEALKDDKYHNEYADKINGYTKAINEALKDEGALWFNALNKAGFTVIQAI